MRDDLYSAICDIPVIDVHSHLSRDQLAAPDLGKMVFQHMLCYPMQAVGIDPDILWAGGEPGALSPFVSLADAWPKMANTTIAVLVRLILRELYGVDEPITSESLERIEQAYAAHAGQSDWGLQVLKRSGAERVLSSVSPTEPLAGPEDDPGIRLTVEIPPPWGGPKEYRPWGKWLARQADGGREIRTLDDLQAYVDDLYAACDVSQGHAVVAWVGSQCDFTPHKPTYVDAIFDRARQGKFLGPEYEAVLHGQAIRCICKSLLGKTGLLQLCYGIQYLHGGAPRPIARADANFAGGLGYLLAEFPQLHFSICNGYEPDEPKLCSLAQVYPNISLDGFWWAMFYPAAMQRALDRRLDIVPVGRLCGFISDAYFSDWLYGKLRLFQRVLAEVLSAKVDRGIYTLSQAIGFAQQMLLDTPQRIFLPRERF